MSELNRGIDFKELATGWTNAAIRVYHVYSILTPHAKVGYPIPHVVSVVITPPMLNFFRFSKCAEDAFRWCGHICSGKHHSYFGIGYSLWVIHRFLLQLLNNLRQAALLLQLTIYINFL